MVRAFSYFGAMKKILLLFIGFCLFPLHQNAQQTVGLIYTLNESFEGYTLFHPNTGSSTYLIDNCGNKVHEWPGMTRPGLGVYLLENGMLLRSGKINSQTFQGGGIGGRIELVNWDGQLEWAATVADHLQHQHHDIEPMPNGNILVLAWDYYSAEEAIEAGRDPNQIGFHFWSEKVMEIRPIGNSDYQVVWEWKAWDHLVQDVDSTKDNFGVVEDHPELLNLNFDQSFNQDWLHCNSIAYNETHDQIILSSRTLSEVFIIDHSTSTAQAAGHSGGNSGKGGDLLYRWGNPRNYDRGSFTDQRLFGQHNAHWIPEDYPDGGSVMIFNNGINRNGNEDYSSVDIITPPVDIDGNYSIGEGEAFGPQEAVWTFFDTPTQNFYSVNISGAQRLPNGHTLICEGNQGHFFEINTDQTIIWEYISPISGGIPLSQGDQPNSNGVFRAERYALDFPAFEGKDLSMGEPIEFDPIPLECQLVDVQDVETEFHFEIFPNPASSVLMIQSGDEKEHHISIFDAQGKKYMHQTFETSLRIDISHLQAGLYILVFDEHQSKKFFISR